MFVGFSFGRKFRRQIFASGSVGLQPSDYTGGDVFLEPGCFEDKMLGTADYNQGFLLGGQGIK